MFYLLILQQSGIKSSSWCYILSYSISNRRSRWEECDAAKIILIKDQTRPSSPSKFFCPEAKSTHRVEPTWVKPNWTESSRTKPTGVEPIRTEPRLLSQRWPLTESWLKFFPRLFDVPDPSVLSESPNSHSIYELWKMVVWCHFKFHN